MRGKKKKKNQMIVEEGKERKALAALPHDCKVCGESSEYAKMYGCPCGYNGGHNLPDCPHDKGLRKKYL